jgi:predicted amidohydrolase YtcJ
MLRVAIMCGFLSLAAALPAAAQTITADTVLVGGKIVTVDRGFSTAQAVAVKGDRILAVGTNEAIRTLVGPATRVIELGGKTVIPGLNDSHLHLLNAGLNLERVALGTAKTMKDVTAAIAARVAQTRPGEWVLGSSNWHESQLAEGRLPTRSDLDAVAPNNPVYLPRGGHVVTMNSAALKLGNVTKDTPDPAGGVIVRDAAGEPTGVMFESAAFGPIQRLIPQPNPAGRRDALKRMMVEANRLGITGLVEPGLSLADIGIYMDLWRGKELTTRVRMLQRTADSTDVETLGRILAPNFGDDMLRIGGFKYLADGGVEGAYLREPYLIVEGEQTDPKYVGKLLLPAGGLDELRKLYLAAAQRGWQVQTHAVGDATIDQVVALYDEVNKTVPIRDLRWAIMHIFLPSEQALDTMKRLGVYATVQDHPTLLGFNMRRYWGEQRAAYGIPLRAIMDKGIATAGGTDGPVVSWNPFVSIWWMTTRKTYNGDKPLGPEQAISREDALRIYTMGTAALSFAEDKVGSLEAGKLADLVVLTDDLMTVPADKIPDITAALTMVSGKIVYQKGD